MRTPTFSAFALVALLCAASAGCSSPNAAGRGASVMVGPATKDTQNVHLPAVRVVTTIFYGETVQILECSGVLVRPRVVLTAGHCVCRFREPTPSDNLPTEKSPKPDAGAVVTRARALKGVTVTEILDRRSSCGKHPIVGTLVYGKPGEEPEPQEYSGTVVVHPDIELIAGAFEGKAQVVWNHADLAVIRLDEPVTLNFQPIVLTDSEVKIGDALVMSGYGPTVSGGPYGARRSGENKVTKILRYSTGNVVFGAAAPPSPDGGVPAHTRPGDSGGPCGRGDNQNVLIGIVTMGEKSDAGDETSYCTSIYPHEGWLLDFIRQNDLATDAGVRAPDSDAGVNVRGSDAGQTPSPRPATP